MRAADQCRKQDLDPHARKLSGEFERDRAAGAKACDNNRTPALDGPDLAREVGCKTRDAGERLRVVIDARRLKSEERVGPNVGGERAVGEDRPAMTWNGIDRNAAALLVRAMKRNDRLRPRKGSLPGAQEGNDLCLALAQNRLAFSAELAAGEGTAQTVAR